MKKFFSYTSSLNKTVVINLDHVTSVTFEVSGDVRSALVVMAKYTDNSQEKFTVDKPAEVKALEERLRD